MAIVNRDLDSSTQQQELRTYAENAVIGTGLTRYMYTAAHPQTIQNAKFLASGISGTPTVTLQLRRYVAGAGNTTISISGALTAVASGSFGVMTFSLPAAGSSLLNLQTNDTLCFATGGANSAVNDAVVSLVLKNTQDMLSWF